jgi:hypothetical protein
MGSYISKDYCESNFGITVNCDGPRVQNNRTVQVGNIQRGQFLSDPDIAGIGVSMPGLSLFVEKQADTGWLERSLPFSWRLQHSH